MSTKQPAKESLTATHQALLVNGNDKEFRALLHRFFAFGSRLDGLRSNFGNHIGLSPSQYMVLITIAQMEGEEAGISQVAERLYLSGAFVTIEVNRLVKLDLVAKEPHPQDRRRVILALTGEGRQALYRLAKIQRPVNDALFEDIDAEEFAFLCRIMAKLLTNAQKAESLAKHLVEHASGGD